MFPHQVYIYLMFDLFGSRVTKRAYVEKSTKVWE
jgi:hypothetical protein